MGIFSLQTAIITRQGLVKMQYIYSIFFLCMTGKVMIYSLLLVLAIANASNVWRGLST
jgi:hypothetical protein